MLTDSSTPAAMTPTMSTTTSISMRVKPVAVRKVRMGWAVRALEQLVRLLIVVPVSDVGIDAFTAGL